MHQRLERLGAAGFSGKQAGLAEMREELQDRLDDLGDQLAGRVLRLEQRVADMGRETSRELVEDLRQTHGESIRELRAQLELKFGELNVRMEDLADVRSHLQAQLRKDIDSALTASTDLRQEAQRR